MTPSERIAEIDARLAEIRDLPDDDMTDDALDEAETLMGERADVEQASARDDRRQQIRDRAANLLDSDDDDDGDDDRSGGQGRRRSLEGDSDRAPAFHRDRGYEIPAGATPGQVRDQAMQAIERQVEPWSAEGAESAERHVRRSNALARHITIMSDPAYQDVFRAVAMEGRRPDRDEQMVIDRAAMAVGTNTAGGLMVPTHLDPAIILTNDGTINPMRSIARVETLPVGGPNQWNGITSAGVTASYDAELAEVSDDSPAVAAAAVPVHKGAAFAQASVEALDDIASLESQLLRLFADAKDRLQGSADVTGSGTNQPTGIFTALDANTNVEVANETANTFGVTDVYGVRAALPARFRGMAAWFMDITTLDKIRQFGTANNYHGFTVDLTSSGDFQLLGRPVAEASDAPDFALTTTVVDNLLVVGDFSNYVIVDKAGMRVRLYDNLLNATSNLPDGRVGWYVYWRDGGDSVNDLAFRLLQDGTTA